jgi:hypothetical protein
MWVITFTSSVQVSGVRFQQPNLNRYVAVAHEIDLLSPVPAFIKRTTRNRNSHSIAGIPAVNAKGLPSPAFNTET